MKLLDLFVKQVLTEGRVDDLRKKYGFDRIEGLEDVEDDFDRLINLDPSPTKKYLEWMVKQYID